MLEGIRFWGNSFICGAQGEILARAESGKEAVLTADIDMSRTKAVRDIWPFFRDRRIDAYGEITRRYCR
jgi:N-carbamoylputrescine amidase